MITSTVGLELRYTKALPCRDVVLDCALCPSIPAAFVSALHTLAVSSVEQSSASQPRPSLL